MKGHLAAIGFRVSESRISERVYPDGHEARRSNTINPTSPIRYQAKYFGHKLHVDQKEKLIEYGMTHVMSQDGFSGKVISFLTLPIKNNLAIYDKVYMAIYDKDMIRCTGMCHLHVLLIHDTSPLTYRAAVDIYGLWDQVRKD